ncbi:trimeric intracellular cation channel family protein [Ochrobactrum teleogrylli]|uniref:trimeric intracellular cation channel family protein n=1 Tax=Ochrobactrum teleogrylli TaxID=2479765 RepID=UPI00384C11EC
MVDGQLTSELIHLLYLIAIVAEAMTAALAAGRRQMDWVGVFVLGCVTALGGGTLRDLLLDHHPLSWVAHPSYLFFTGGGALLTVIAARYMHHLRGIFLFLDAIGLVVFTVIGCSVAMTMNLPFVVVIASGVITGCAGGVLRDILCNEVPLLFRSELYATVSVFCGLLYLIGLYFEYSQSRSAVAAITTGLLFRLFAIHYNWSMPKFVYNKDLH